VETVAVPVDLQAVGFLADVAVESKAVGYAAAKHATAAGHPALRVLAAHYPGGEDA
jgi:hypothetical protein